MYVQAKVEQIYGDVYQATRNTWKFRSVGQYIAYADEHPEASHVVSPGGAAGSMGVSRQRVYDMIKQGHLRAWFVYESGLECHDVPGNRASYVFVSSEDIKRYMNTPKSKGGRPVKVV